MHITRTSSTPGKRGGLTLAEVLVAVMLMAIGVISLATLFPLSVLRSVRAAQLTNATIHRFNAEEYLSFLPDMTDSRPAYTPRNDGDRLVVVVDPIGTWDPTYAAKVQGTTPVYGNHAGNSAQGSTGVTVPRTDGLNNMLVGNRPASARELATLPDSWRNVHEGEVSDLTPAGVEMPGGFTELDPLTTAGVPDAPIRLILTYTDGRLPVTRNVTAVAGRNITVAPPLTAAEAANPASAIARFDVRDDRYTWMMTVRKRNSAGAISSSVDVVVFFKRTFSEADEQVYHGPGGGPTFKQGSVVGVVSWAGGRAKPELRAGNFTFDARNGHWYRIRSFAVNGEQAIITIDRPAVAATEVMTFPSGVVDVYPLGAK